jgi:hypothetical protein
LAGIGVNEGVLLSPAIPTTLHDWERTLTVALLRSGDRDSDAIRSFEITPETLAMHCGLGVEHAGTAEAAFKRALQVDPHLSHCLQHGAYKIPGTEQPNCLAMLALTLLVDSLLDGVYEDKGQYRSKLAEWLNSDRSFTDLRGIATMWRELVAWLDERIAAGAPFRRLVLPDIPATWTHIGYTRYLSFPTKRDLRLLTKQIARLPRAGLDPAALVVQLDPLVRTTAASHGLKVAFDDFKKALRSGAASVDHRFWRLVVRAREQCGYTASVQAVLVMEFDEDGNRRFRVGSSGGDDVAAFALLGSAVASPAIMESLNLGPAIRRGILFFRSSGLASWIAAGEPPPGSGPFHIAIASRHFRLAGGAIVDFLPTGSWLVSSKPMPSGTVSDVMRRIGISDAKQTVRTIGLVDGIHIGSAWLGQPRYLPYLEGASGNVEIASIDGGAAGRLKWANGDLRADAPVDGRFALSDAAAHWSRRATFSSLAEVHPHFESAAYCKPEQQEWRLTEGPGLGRIADCDLKWDDAPDPYQDVVEALYASSRSGAGEGEAVAIIGRAHGRRNWDVLRSMQEATFYDARLQQSWKGRVFTLRRPTVTSLRIGRRIGVVVSGAIPSRLEADFRATVELQGGRAFRRRSDDILSPPVLGAVDIDPIRLVEALGWSATDPMNAPDGTPEKRLFKTKVRGEGYEASSWWDWSLGRFSVRTPTPGKVGLTRLVHPGGRDHDIYRVVGRIERSFLSRHSAILDAHWQAGVPLFRYENGVVVRIPLEGALPLEIAAALRLRTLSNGGPTKDSWGYRAGSPEIAWLAGLLPGLISGAGVGNADDWQLTARRGRGARRPLWELGMAAV